MIRWRDHLLGSLSLQRAYTRTADDSLADPFASSDGDVLGIEHLELQRDTLLGIGGVVLGFHAIEEGTKLALLDPSHISDKNLSFTISARLRDPERVAIANRKELLSVDVPRILLRGRHIGRGN